MEIYCENKHASREKAAWRAADQRYNAPGNSPVLCRECSDLLDYSISRRTLCPLNPKPTCKNCKIHCYANAFRTR
ncbi:MAG: nitrous oxide-stimulated promoter family protein [Candidatus Bathyarchaeota archaeon]|nr:nitrous oxide-stimulated promoter family protein [Candidatus Bathyarchaeota archaeon]